MLKSVHHINGGEAFTSIFRFTNPDAEGGCDRIVRKFCENPLVERLETTRGEVPGEIQLAITYDADFFGAIALAVRIENASRDEITVMPSPEYL